MAAAVLQHPISSGIMPPSPVSPSFARHGRKGSVSKGNKIRGRGYSIVDEREAAITKALNRILKRSVQVAQQEEQDEEENQENQENQSKKIVADKDGWASLDEVLQQPDLAELEITLEDVESLIAARSRFTLKPNPSAPPAAKDDAPSAYLIRVATAAPPTPSTAAVQAMTPLTSDSDNLPALVVYETSYANYPLVLASGGIKRAGGQAYLAFNPIPTSTEVPTPAADTDVSIYIDLASAMAADSHITWLRGQDNGTIYTTGDAHGVVGKHLWSRAVGRRTDIGTLFADGEVKKEVPMGLRGKGVRGKKGGMKGNLGKGKALKDIKAGSEDEESTSD